MSNKMISDKSILTALPRVALTPAWLRAKSMLTELHSRLQQTATHQQHQSNRQLRPFWCLVLQQTSVKFRSEMWTEHRPRLFAGWYLFSVLSPVQTPADKCKTVRWQWSTMLWHPVVVVVSVGDDHNDLWLLVQGLGLRTKLASSSSVSAKWLFTNTASFGKPRWWWWYNIPDLQIQPGKNKSLDLM